MAKLNEDKILIIKGVQEFRSSGGKPYGFFGVQEASHMASSTQKFMNIYSELL
jgi:hypothetical protein